MNDIRDLLRRQARWQKARKDLPWPEKIRMAEAIRDSVLELSATGGQDKGPITAGMSTERGRWKRSD